MSTILCFGDSNTYAAEPAGTERFGGRFPPEIRWPGVLRGSLGAEFEVLEDGLNGRTTIWDDPFEAGRNGCSYLLPCLRAHAPIDLVVLALGVNDLKAVFPATPREIASSIAALAGIVTRSGCGPGGFAPLSLLISPPPILVTPTSKLWGFGDAAEASRQLAGYYERAARRDGHAFLDAGTVVTVSSADGVHLDEEGHRRLGEAVARAVREALK